MHRNEMLHPRRIQECFQCCPNSITTYAMVNLDSIGKIVNHLLMLMLVFNLFLFFASWSISFLPIMGFNTIMTSFLLCTQNVTVWLILNNNRISALSFLSPTEFMVGLALGITIGGTILALVISRAFSQVSECEDAAVNTNPIYKELCGGRKGSLNAVWLWSGLIFWLNFCCSLLLAVGRRELSTQGQYESVGLGMDDFENHFQQQQSQGIVPTFQGNYVNIPEVRSGDDMTTSISGNSRQHAEYQTSSEQQAYLTSV